MQVYVVLGYMCRCHVGVLCEMYSIVSWLQLWAGQEVVVLWLWMLCYVYSL